MAGIESAQRPLADSRLVLNARKNVLQAAPGLLLCAAVAIPSWELSRFYTSLDALSLSLILGMVLRNVLGAQASLEHGVRVAGAIFVPLGIVLYGARLDFAVFNGLPVYTSALVIAAMAAFFGLIMLMARIFKIDRRTGLLLASGTAICGASAIAVLSPILRARSRDTSVALIVTTTAGLTGVFLYPLIGDWFSLSETAYGLFSGSTLQQTGVVKLAASHYGEAAVAQALAVKMVRIAMLAPVALILAAMFSFTADRSGGGRPRAFAVAVRRAWFVPLFLLTAVLFSFWQPAVSSKEFFEPLGTISLSLALASIGLLVDFDSIKDSGSAPLLTGFAGWIAVSLLFLLVLIPLSS